MPLCWTLESSSQLFHMKLDVRPHHLHKIVDVLLIHHQSPLQEAQRLVIFHRHLVALHQVVSDSCHFFLFSTNNHVIDMDQQDHILASPQGWCLSTWREPCLTQAPSQLHLLVVPGESDLESIPAEVQVFQPMPCPG